MKDVFETLKKVLAIVAIAAVCAIGTATPAMAEPNDEENTVLTATDELAAEAAALDEATDMQAAQLATTTYDETVDELDAEPTAEDDTILGMNSGNMKDFYSLLARLVINFIVVAIIARCFYYPKSKRRDYMFIFLIMAMSIFLLVSLMEGSKMKTGAALGLFAIFGIIRYRTEAVPIREMTYLFMLVSVSVINAMIVKIHMENVCSLALANIFFILLAALFESSKLVSDNCSKYVKYDNVNLIQPEKREELIADLKKRTGLNIVGVEIGTIDFLKDSCLLRVFYDDPNDKNNSMNEMGRLPKK